MRQLKITIRHIRLRAAALAAGLAVAMEAFVFPVYAKPVWPSDTGIQAEAGIVVDQETGAVIFGQNIHLPYAPASITKLLTALVVIENCESLDEMVTFSHDAVYNVESGSGNALSLEEGDQLTVRDCLYAMLLRSSNQAANALAEHVGGTREGFVAMMNDTIRELGCTESNFANPSGLNDDNQYVSAYDMAIIGRAAFANETLLEINASTSYNLPATFHNPDGLRVNMEHKLLITTDESSDTYYPYAVAGKTGFTSIAGNTLVTLADNGDRSQVAVILKSNWTHYSDTIALMDFGFSRFQNLDASGDEATLFDESGSLTVEGETYQQDQLGIDGVQKVTVPLEAALTDTDRTLVSGEAMGAGAPEKAVAQVRYTYDDRLVGSYYLVDIRTEEEMAPANGQTGDGENDPAGEESPEDGQETGSPAAGFAIPRQVFLIGGIAAGSAALIILLAAVIHRNREQERREMEERRERRRKRLAEIGCSEEEFRRLVEERYGNPDEARDQDAEDAYDKDAEVMDYGDTDKKPEEEAADKQQGE